MILMSTLIFFIALLFPTCLIILLIQKLASKRFKLHDILPIIENRKSMEVNYIKALENGKIVSCRINPLMESHIEETKMTYNYDVSILVRHPKTRKHVLVHTILTEVEIQIFQSS